MVLSSQMEKTLILIHSRLADVQTDWLVGGSCGLLMQGVQLTREPRDLDIYVDRPGAPLIYHALEPYATDELGHNETEIYVSLLSHYQIESVIVELVGGFEVKAEQSNYQVEVSSLLTHYSPPYPMKGNENIRLMPLAHELIFNVLRNRPDRYVAIAEAILSSEQKRTSTMELMHVIKQRNSFAPHILKLLHRLLPLKGVFKK